MKPSNWVPVAAICSLFLAAAIVWWRGKDDQRLEGIAIQDNGRYEFFPGATGCELKGPSYLILPSKPFSDGVVEQTSVFDMESLLHSTWKLTLRGDISHAGRFGVNGRNLRELKVRFVIDALKLDCQKNQEQLLGKQ